MFLLISRFLANDILIFTPSALSSPFFGFDWYKAYKHGVRWEVPHIIWTLIHTVYTGVYDTPVHYTEVYDTLEIAYFRNYIKYSVSQTNTLLIALLVELWNYIGTTAQHSIRIIFLSGLHIIFVSRKSLSNIKTPNLGKWLEKRGFHCTKILWGFEHYYTRC